MSDKKLKLGLASYSVRKFPLTQALAMTKRVGVDNIALKDFHLPLTASRDEIMAAAKEVREAGINLVGCGVVYMADDEAFIRNVFEYAKAAGMSVIIASPEPSALPICNRFVQQYDLKLAIHNHGPGDKKYPLATDAYNLVKDMDPRMGVCPDIGHIKRLGYDPVNELKAVADRMHDLHVKDVSAAEAAGHNIEMGRGVIDIPAVLRRCST